MEPQLLALLLGSLIGLALALTGAGGGILAVPLLVFGLQLSILEAAPVGLLAVGLAALLGAGLAFREGNLRYRAAGLIGVAGVSTVPLGLWLAHQVPVAPLTAAFAALLAYVAVRTIRDARRPANQAATYPSNKKLPCVLNPEEARLDWTARCARALMMTGGLSGILSGALGVGGGFVIVPALARYTNLNQRSVVSTSLGVIALVSTGGVITAALTGKMLWPVAIPFALGAAAGILGGRTIADRVSGPALKQAFGVVSLIAAAMLVYRLI